jgi:transcriptional regulator with XRE-family HTH domain
MAKRPLRVDVTVGRNIRICRLQRGLTQSELGGHLGVTPQQIQKYETGANRVGASRLDQLAGALAVPLATLFDGRPGNGNARASSGHASPDLDGGALLAHPHALRLAQAFNEIPETRRRVAILRLIEMIGNGTSRRRLPGRGRRRLH